MNIGQQEDLLNLLKVLGQAQRLTLLGLINERELNVGDLAAQLDLTEPTVSHHLSKLHGVGLLTLRMQGTQRFYRLNRKRLDVFKRYVSEIEILPSRIETETADHAWIEALDWAEEDKKVLQDYLLNGRLKQIPAKQKKWLVLIRWIATLFEADRFYTEKEVNEILKRVHEDFATIRRDLVDFGYMRRERGGGSYWLAPLDTPS